MFHSGLSSLPKKREQVEEITFAPAMALCFGTPGKSLSEWHKWLGIYHWMGRRVCAPQEICLSCLWVNSLNVPGAPAIPPRAMVSTIFLWNKSLPPVFLSLKAWSHSLVGGGLVRFWSNISRYGDFLPLENQVSTAILSNIVAHISEGLQGICFP